MKYRNFCHHLARFCCALSVFVSVVLPAHAGEGGIAAGNGDLSAVPFPVSASVGPNAQKEVFSYALESGFVRVSFANMKAAPLAEKARKAPKMQKMPADTAQTEQIYGLIAMDLKQGWKTYWRNPGTSGFAPKIELNGGAKAEILFPVPQLFQEQGEWTYGYKNHVLLPFRIILPKQPQQNFYTGALIIGICGTLCMPQKIPFQFNAAMPFGARTSAEIAAALKTLPEATDKDFQIVSAKAIKGGVRLTLRYPQNSGEPAPQLFLDGGDMQIGLAQPQPALAKSKNKRGPDRHDKAKTGLQIYEAQLLFGEAESGAPIAYTAVLQAGNAVSGIVKITAKN